MSDEKPNRFYRTKEGADYVAALEALAVELAGVIDALMSQSSFGGIRFDSDREPDMAASKRAAKAALSSPLLAEIRAKEGV
jgi:hypothetical protein